MNVRPAEASDGDAVGDVVRQSMRGSYALSPQTIDGIVGQYDGDALADRLEEGVHLVAETDTEVVGYAEGRVEDGVGELLWLHVAPQGRGQGAGTELFERLREAFESDGASHVRARVLADNQEGSEFFERFDLTKAAKAEAEWAGESLSEHVYVDDEAAIDEETMTVVGEDLKDEKSVDVPERVEVDDREVYVDGDDRIPGDKGPFFTTYSDEDHEEKYGYYCTNCGSMATAMDELGQVKCEECGNTHRADEWDGAYL